MDGEWTVQFGASVIVRGNDDSSRIVDVSKGRCVARLRPRPGCPLSAHALASDIKVARAFAPIDGLLGAKHGDVFDVVRGKLVLAAERDLIPEEEADGAWPSRPGGAADA